MRSSIREKKEKESKKKNHRSMVPVGYYCADCKKFLTTEEYNQKSNEGRLAGFSSRQGAAVISIAVQQ